MGVGRVTCVIGDGLGNRLFQIAAMLGYAEKYGHTPVFVREWVKSNPAQSGGERVCEYFPDILTISADELEWTEIREEFVDAMTYHPLPRILGNVKLCGAFQSELYFPSGGVRLSGVVPRVLREGPALFLHVRRGDYLHPFNQHHYVELGMYYERSLGLFDSGASIVVCSDDIEWCKATLPRRYPAVSADKWIWFGGDEYATLGAMMACSLGGICANSTFSWWGAYLGFSSGKLVTMPSLWIQLRAGFPKAIDIYPSWAEKIAV